MAKKDIRKNILEDAEKVEPIADFYGIKITSFEDGVTLRKADAIEEDEPDISERLLNPDGTVARSAIRYASVNPRKMFDNRVRRIKKDDKDVLQVVVDKRAISEMGTGSVYLKNIPCYEIARVSKELKVIGLTNVLDTEFMSDFKGRLDHDAMVQILPLIDNYGSEMTSESLGI